MIRVYLTGPDRYNPVSIINAVADTFVNSMRGAVQDRLERAYQGMGIVGLLNRCEALGCDVVTPESGPLNESCEAVQLTKEVPDLPHDPNVIEKRAKYLSDG